MTLLDVKHPGLQKAARIAAKHSALAGSRPLLVNKDDGRAELYVYDQIGADWWAEGITAKSVQEALATAKGKALDVFINSPGGDIFEAKAILAQLERHDGEITMHIDGIAASAATFIAMAGDKIITHPAATWMIHEVHAFAGGNAGDFRALAETLDKENRTFAETYAKRTKQSVEDVLAWMNVETWMTAKEAKERGFTDEISDDEDESSAKAQAALKSPKDTERFLRDAGLSRSQAKALLALGYDGLNAPRDAGAEDLEALNNLSQFFEAATRG